MKFFADRMLGKLARWLRVMGVDCEYWMDVPSQELARRARAERGVILTRAARFAAKLAEGEVLLIFSSRVEGQIREFVSRYGMPDPQMAFGRCILCNILLEDVPKEQLRFVVPPYVFSTQEEFKSCPSCHRIFWKATHYRRMLEKMGRMKNSKFNGGL